MKTNKSLSEKRVRQNAIIIFLLAILLCGGMIHYIIDVKKSIGNQRDNIRKNEEILTLTNILIEKVNTAQSYANLYIYSGSKNNLDNFNIITSEITKISDSLTILCDNNFDINTLNSISDLLTKKENNIKEISKQLNSFNPYVEIYSIIDSYQNTHKKSTISTSTYDTIVYKSEKKNFFKRLSNVFSPDKSLDSIVLVSKTTIDTISEDDNETNNLLNEIQLSTERDRKKYVKQIETFERKHNNLALSDQEITKEISYLLINLHKHTLNSVVREIQESENIINRNINFSFIIAIIALLTILAFVLLIFNNINNVVKARIITEEARKRTEEIMESRHKLLLSVSHDIKAPLSSILGYLELMQMENTNEKEKSKFNSMRNSAEHILSLLSNLLNFSRLDQGKESCIMSEFDINNVCDALSEMFKPLADEKKLSFIYENDLNENTFICSDALKIKQIISNLLSNAIKYTTKGKIIFNISKNDKEIIFNIIDEGIGIPEDKLAEIYKPFSRIDNKESIIEGSGFGLFVVKGLIDLLNGFIEVDSEPQKGSHFIVRIPVEFVKECNIEENIDIQDVCSDINSKILVIDDDNTLLTVIESMMMKLGCKCDICLSSVDFDNYLKHINEYDIILTDREMGAFTGLEVLSKIKGINKEKEVILMTARSEYNREIALDNGFNDYLRKPFSISDLARILNNHVNFCDDKTTSRYEEDFPELCSMFDNDDDTIENILRTFIESTSNNLVIFNNMISENNFREAANICHKMYPMFVQLSRNKSADFLYKMDNMRDLNETSFPDWKKEADKFMSDVDELFLYLSDKYGIE